MNSFNKLMFIVCLFLSFVSCSSDKIEWEPITIDVLNNKGNPVRLSELGESIKYIPLQMPADIGIEVGYDKRVFCAKDHILYFSTFKSNSEEIFFKGRYLLFDREGIYKGEIEVADGYSFSVGSINHKINDTEDSICFIRWYMENMKRKNEIVIYDLYTQICVDSLSLDKRASFVSWFDKNKFLLYDFNLVGKTEYKLSVMNSKGEGLLNIEHPEQFELKNTTYYVTAGTAQYATYKKDGLFHVFISHENAIYILTEDLQIYPKYFFDLGEKQMPYYYTSKTPYPKIENTYFTIQNAQEFKDYLFYEYVDPKGLLYYCVYNTKEKIQSTIKGDHIHNTRSTCGIDNDIDDGTNFWPSSFYGDELVGYIGQTVVIVK